MKPLPDLMSPKPVNTGTPKFLQRAFIQGRLLSLRDDSVFAEGVRQGAVTDLNGCIKMILCQAEDNREMLERIIGEQLLKDIENL